MFVFAPSFGGVSNAHLEFQFEKRNNILLLCFLRILVCNSFYGWIIALSFVPGKLPVRFKHRWNIAPLISQLPSTSTDKTTLPLRRAAIFLFPANLTLEVLVAFTMPEAFCVSTIRPSGLLQFHLVIRASRFRGLNSPQKRGRKNEMFLYMIIGGNVEWPSNTSSCHRTITSFSTLPPHHSATLGLQFSICALEMVSLEHLNGYWSLVVYHPYISLSDVKAPLPESRSSNNLIRGSIPFSSTNDRHLKTNAPEKWPAKSSISVLCSSSISVPYSNLNKRLWIP